uniref:Uncharacterized protein n=1 Tax=Balaenoptera musculus TaxID=9771 RepID=A0A8C0E7N5_BALMU
IPCSLVTTCDRKAVMKNANMSEEMQQDSGECGTQELEKYAIGKDVAAPAGRSGDPEPRAGPGCPVAGAEPLSLVH